MQPDRPRGMVAFGVELTAPEAAFLEVCLKIMDQEPAFDELPPDFRRSFNSTPDQVLGVLQPLSRKVQACNVSFTLREGTAPGSSIVDIVSLNVDVAALGHLVWGVGQSGLPRGFPFTPMGPELDRDDPRLRLEPNGGLVKITDAMIEVIDTGGEPSEGIRRWIYHTP